MQKISDKNYRLTKKKNYCSREWEKIMRSMIQSKLEKYYRQNNNNNNDGNKKKREKTTINWQSWSLVVVVARNKSYDRF